MTKSLNYYYKYSLRQGQIQKGGGQLLAHTDHYQILNVLLNKHFQPGILVFCKLQNDAHEARCRTMQRRRYITMNLQLLASILTYWTSKIKYDFLVAVLARTFVNILNLLLSLYYLVFCESQCHCGYIDMFSFQLFTNIICKNTDNGYFDMDFLQCVHSNGF